MSGEVGLPQFFLFRCCFLNYLDEGFFSNIFLTSIVQDKTYSSQVDIKYALYVFS